MDFAQFFQSGGFFMTPILLVGVLSAVTGLVAVLVRLRPAAIAAFVCGGLCLGIGVVVYGFGMIEVMNAVATVVPEQYDEAYAAGAKYAKIPLQFAGVLATPGLLGGAVASVFRRRPR
jgi:hypothetical protein